MFFAYLAASGLAIGIFSKSFTLVVSSMLVSLAILNSAVKVGDGQRGDSARTIEQLGYRVVVIAKMFDSAARRGLGEFQVLENKAGEAENAPRSLTSTVGATVAAECDLRVPLNELYRPKITIDNSVSSC